METKQGQSYPSGVYDENSKRGVRVTRVPTIMLRNRSASKVWWGIFQESVGKYGLSELHARFSIPKTKGQSYGSFRSLPQSGGRTGPKLSLGVL